MINKLKKVGAGLTAITTGLSFHNYYLTIKDQKVKELLDRQITENQKLQDQINNLIINKTADIENTNKMIRALEESTMNLKINLNKLSNYNINVNTPSTSNSNSAIIEAINKNKADFSKIIEQGTEQLDQLAQIIADYNNNNSSYNNTWIDQITEFISLYQDWFNTLTLEQKGAMVHISSSVLILFLLSSIFTVFYSDLIIKYFNLSDKYPRLKKYIELRRTFQQYYFLFNFIAICIILLLLILINLYVLI